MPSKSYVWDPEARKAYKIGSKEAIAAGFSNCTGGRVPSYATGNCLKVNGDRYKDLGLYKDREGNPRPDTYVFRSDMSKGSEAGKWFAECSPEARDINMRCCPGKNSIPSPDTGYCIKVGGPTYQKLGLSQAKRGDIDYFTTTGSFDDKLPVPQGPFWPAGTHMVDDEDYQNSEAGSRARMATMQQRRQRQSEKAVRMAASASARMFKPAGALMAAPKPAVQLVAAPAAPVAKRGPRVTPRRRNPAGRFDGPIAPGLPLQLQGRDFTGDIYDDLGAFDNIDNNFNTNGRQLRRLPGPNNFNTNGLQLRRLPGFRN